MKKLISLVILSTLTGCSAFKEHAGEYVTEAVILNIEHRVDTLLEKRGLNVATLRDVLDDNNNQVIEKDEVIDTAKETAKDVALLEAQRLVQEQIAENTKTMASASDVEKSKLELWNWILGLVAAYLGKQIWSAKQDGKRDQKIAVVEQLLNRDIDGDGRIGVNPSNSNPASA